MTKGKLVAIAAGGMAVGALTLPMVAAHGSQPLANQPVTVTNTSSEPVPVTGSVGIDANQNQVTISGTPSVALSGTPGVNVTDFPSSMKAEPVAPGRPLLFQLFTQPGDTGDQKYLNGGGQQNSLSGQVAITSIVLTNQTNSATEVSVAARSCDDSQGYGGLSDVILGANQTQQFTYPSPVVLPAGGPRADWCLFARILSTNGNNLVTVESDISGYHV